jgi:hypothetical protein
MDRKDRMPGGLADDRTPLEFAEDALQEGIEVEMEHTDDPDIAIEIAMDHLTEDPQYYVKLREIEGAARYADGPGRGEANVGYMGSGMYFIEVPNSSADLQQEMADNVPAKQKRKGDVSSQSGYKVFFYSRGEAKKVYNYLKSNGLRVNQNTMWGGKDYKLARIAERVASRFLG